MNSFKNGFFYNCGKTLFWLFLIIFISLLFRIFKFDLKDALMVENVDAVEQYSGWGISDLQVPYHVYGVNGKTEIPLKYQYRKEQEGTGLVTNLLPSIFSFLETDKAYSLTSSNSTSLGFMVNYRFLGHHSYVVKYNVCFNSEPNKDTNFFLGGKSDALNQNNSADNSFYNFTRSRSSLSTVPGYADQYMSKSFNYQYCFQEQLIFASKIDANFINIKFLRSSTSSSWMALVGLDIRDNGLSASYIDSEFSAIKSAINSLSADVQNSTQSTINNQNSNTQQQISNANSNQSQTNSNLNKINDSINNDNVEDANGSASSFFNDFQNDDYGLADIITMPLEYITSISSAQCQPLSFSIPFVNQNAELPCMYSIYQQYFGSFLSIYQVITTGFISYWIFINIFAMLRGFSNPFSDKVEVLEL